jgi:alanine racemase
MRMKQNSWIYINKSALFNNVDQYRSLIGASIPFAPVIKSNAYGHGLTQIAALCQENTKVDWLCVALLSEAIQLRNAGITKPLLVLSIIDDELEHIINYNIRVVAYDIGFILALQKVAEKLKQPASIHLKIDTGLSRAGFLYNEALPIIKKINQLPYINLNGIFTHFANSESSDSSFTNLQINRFQQLLTELDHQSIPIPYKHVSCSAALSVNHFPLFSFVRAGIGVYGLWSSPEIKLCTQKQFPHFNIKAVLTWKTQIIQIKTIAADSFVGYDITYQTARETRIALLPIGYWDGYDRKLSNCSIVKVGDYYAPVIGRIAMNLTVIDITNIPNVQVDDEVILLGNDPKISAEALAQKIGTINYEVVTRINPQIPRIIID